MGKAEREERSKGVGKAEGVAKKKKKVVKKSNGFDPTQLDEHSRLIVQVRKVMKQRDAAREAGDFSKSDAYREQLNDLGVDVKDQKDGPSGWKFKDGRTRKLKAGTAVPDEAVRGHQEKLKELPESKKLKIKKLKKKIEVGNETERNMRALEGMASNKPGKRVVQGVTIEDKTIGTGAEAVSGRKVKVHYTGSLANGKIFDSSVGKRPFSFALGRGQVIRGWDIGVKGMRVGGRRVLNIPPQMGYGRAGAPPAIPPNAPLNFDVTLLEA